MLLSGQHYLVGVQPLSYEIHGELIGHLLHDQAALVGGVGTCQHLPLGEAFGFRRVRLAVRNLRRLPSPRMVNQKLGIHAEQAVQKVFVVNAVVRAFGAPGDVAHRVQSVLLELARDAVADAPEVCQRTMAPQLLAVGALVERRDAHAVLVRGNMFGHDVHGDLGEIEVGADACGRRDVRLAGHVADHGARKFVRGHARGLQIVRRVDENLVDGVDQKVIHRDIPQVDLDDPARVFHVVTHARRRDDAVDTMVCA